MSIEYTCTNCGANLVLQEVFDPEKGYWTCTACGQQLFGNSEDRKSVTRRFPNVVWHCDECDAVLNVQPGFDDWRHEWTCTECGRVNYIEEDEIVGSGPSRLLNGLVSLLGPARNHANTSH